VKHPHLPRKSHKTGLASREIITLSGLLNFADGLWSCCGNERILIFITNHVEELNDALLRHGRMDLHIRTPYCTFAALKTLVRNYLLLDSHSLFPKVEKLLHTGARVSYRCARERELDPRSRRLQ
jgi:hypothetical protein